MHFETCKLLYIFTNYGLTVQIIYSLDFKKRSKYLSVSIVKMNVGEL